jgi:hypothetical protein
MFGNESEWHGSSDLKFFATPRIPHCGQEILYHYDCQSSNNSKVDLTDSEDNPAQSQDMSHTKKRHQSNTNKSLGEDFITSYMR